MQEYLKVETRNHSHIYYTKKKQTCNFSIFVLKKLIKEIKDRNPLNQEDLI